MLTPMRWGAIAAVMMCMAAMTAPRAESVACPLARLSDDVTAVERLDAIDACGAAADPAAFDRLHAFAADLDRAGDERMAAIYALGQLGDRRATPTLIDILERDMTERRGYAMAAIPALGLIGDARATEILTRALRKRDEHWLGRTAAAWALGRIADPSATPALIDACWAADTRDAAVAALARIGDPRAAEALLSALGDDEMEAETPMAAAAGLTAMGAPILDAVSELARYNFRHMAGPTARERLLRILNTIDDPQAAAFAIRLEAIVEAEAAQIEKQ